MCYLRRKNFLRKNPNKVYYLDHVEAMKIIQDRAENIYITEPLSLTIGNFDGLHLGHQAIIKKCIHIGRLNNSATAVLTFLPPTSRIAKESGVKGNNIYTQKHKICLLSHYDIDYLIIVLTDKNFLSILPKTFVLNFLRKQINCTFLTTGANFRFGKDRGGDQILLKNMAKQHDFFYHTVTLLEKDNYNISSSIIRNLLEHGRIRQANCLLGSRYRILGCVETGQGIAGDNIGFKTANISLEKDMCLPLYGVYYVQVYVKIRNSYNKYYGIANLGIKPTLSSRINPLLEVHLLNFDFNIYKKYILIKFISFIRPERVFIDLPSLQAQINKDIQTLKFLVSENLSFEKDLERHF